jgi:predicted metalloenzyme YecM
MIQSINEFYVEGKKIVAAFDAYVTEHELHELAIVDHFGLRCSSHEVYLNTLELFTYESQYIYTSIISQRPISIIKLKIPLQTVLGELWFLELSDQKPDGSQSNVFDHFEIVAKQTSYQELVQNIQNKDIVLRENIKPHHSTYDIVLPDMVIKLSEERLVAKIKREEMLL